MRPYFAIIKDSFRAAFASRVLYVLLGIITVLLLAIAPFHYRETLDWKIKRDQHVRNPALLVERIVEQKDDKNRLAVKRIWESLPASLQDDMIAITERVDSEDLEAPQTEGAKSNVRIEFKEDDEPHGRGPRPDGNPLRDFPTYDALIEELNNIVQDRDFYHQEDWEQALVSVSPEASELIELGVEDLSEERSRRLNRILIGDALGSAIQNGAATALDFYYLVWKTPISPNTTHQQFASSFSAGIPYVFDKFVMSIGLFIAILVTANIIPETFDPGSLNLLLSKPVSRWALLVAKFIGGCAFVSLCALYLFLGTWMWLGLGMGIWDRGILFAIPVYILVFAIYYSVSTLVGILYRSAILSVILTGIFWALCFGVGLTYNFLDNRMQNAEITKLVPVSNEVLLQVDPLSKVLGWDAKENKWDTRLKASMAQEQEVAFSIILFTTPLGQLPADALGPIHDAKSERLISGNINLSDPGTFNQQECFVSELGGEFKARGKFPRNSVALFAADAGPIAVNSSGEIYLMNFDALAVAEADEPEKPDSTAANEKSVAEKKTETQDPSKKKNKKKPELFDKLGSMKTTINNGNYVDLNQTNQEIVVYRRGEIQLFEPTYDGYRLKAKLEIDTGLDSKIMSCRVGYQGDTITLALGNGQLITLDANTLEEKNGYVPETRSAVKQLEASPDGRWVAVVYRNETLWLLDNENPEQINKASVGSQGTISCVSFTDSNQVWVADRTDRATLYDLESKQQLEGYAPESNWFAFAYRYAVGPVYKVFPKPGELYKVVTYLSSTGDTKYNRDVDLASIGETKDPFGPLWTGLGFMGLVLCLACTVFHFKDY